MTIAVTIRPRVAMTAFRGMAHFPLMSCGRGIMPVSELPAYGRYDKSPQVQGRRPLASLHTVEDCHGR